MTTRFKPLLALLLLGTLSLAQAAESPALPSEEALAQIMKDAREAMREAQYNVAIRNYRELAEMQDHAYRRDALELLGLAYERKGDLPNAKATYQRYIELYPEGLPTERVRQRLAGLDTAAWEPPKRLEKPAEKNKSSWRQYGSFSQYLRRDASSFENQAEVVHNYALTSQLDYNLRGRNDKWDLRSRINTGHSHDLQDKQGDQSTLSYLYLDMQQRQGDWGFRFGRQRANSGGALGRFDGLKLQRRIGKNELQLLLGMPVERSSDTSPDSSRQFYGLNFQSGPLAEHWQASGYLIQQQYDGLLDRRAIGGELRYNHTQRTLYTLLDYDIAYHVLNIANLQATYHFKDKSSINLLLDYRASPVLTTGNALIGQSATSLDELSQLYSETQIRELAEQHTAHNYLASIGFGKPFSKDLRLDLDFSASNLTASDISAGTDDEFFTMGRLTWSNLWRAKDNNIASLRLSDTDNSRSTNLSLSSRQPWGNWRFTPRLQWESRDYTNGDKQATLAPEFRAEYRWQSGHLFELGMGWESIRKETWLGEQKTENSYYSVGYRWQF